MDLQGKHDKEYMLELLTQAHMAGQRDAGCGAPGYSNARADCLKILDEADSFNQKEEWNPYLPEKEGFYWVLTKSGKEHPAKHVITNDGFTAYWTYDHKRVEVIAFKYCPGSYCDK